MMAVSIIAKSQTVTWKVLKNDALDHKNFSVCIDPLFIDLNGNNGYAFGWGTRAEYMMGKMFIMNFDFRSGFGTNGYKISDDNTKNYTYIEGGLGLIFKHSQYSQNVGIILSQSSSTSYYSGYSVTTTTTKYIRGGVPANHLHIWAFRGGLYSYSNSLSYKNLSDSLLIFRGGSKEFTYKDSLGNSKFNTGFGAMTTLAIYGGIQSRLIRDLQIDVDGYGYRENSRYLDYYLDIIFAPVISIKDFSAHGTTYDVNYSKKGRFGWRFGVSNRHPSDQGFNFKFEFGVRPGPRAKDNKGIINLKNWYCMLTYALYFPMKIKPTFYQEKRTSE
ncbi:MAG: hypothetical protein Fur0023_16230 [Bacteroidia bacterium]